MPSTLISIESLITIGFTPQQAAIYHCLLGNTGKTVAEISTELGEQRTNIYHLIEPLLALELIESPKRGLLRITNPQRIRQLVVQKQQEAQKSANELETIFPSLASLFTLTQEAPSIRSYTGAEGLRQLYTEMLHSGTKLIRLFRSVSDHLEPEINQIRAWAITQQVAHGIKTRAITQNHIGARQWYLSGKDTENLVERRIIDSSALDNPAQILLWENCIAITSLEGSVISTVIENEMIAQTFENIFEYIWKVSEADTFRIIQEWESKNTPQ